MGAILLSAGRFEKRHALANARIMIHQPWGGVQGRASDINIQAQEILRLKDRLHEILAVHTRRPLKTVVADSDHDFFMSAEDAKEYGLVDEVLKNRKPARTGK